jgi:hypothetical protein
MSYMKSVSRAIIKTNFKNWHYTKSRSIYKLSSFVVKTWFFYIYNTNFYIIILANLCLQKHKAYYKKHHKSFFASLLEKYSEISYNLFIYSVV